MLLRRQGNVKSFTHFHGGCTLIQLGDTAIRTNSQVAECKPHVRTPNAHPRKFISPSMSSIVSHGTVCALCRRGSYVYILATPCPLEHLATQKTLGSNYVSCRGFLQMLNMLEQRAGSWNGPNVPVTLQLCTRSIPLLSMLQLVEQEAHH